MAIDEIQNGLWTDDAMEDGYIRVVPESDYLNAYVMSPATFRTLSWYGLQAEVFDALDERGPGTHLIPARCIDPAARQELETALEYYEPSDGSSCSLPHCRQDVASTERGFPLCAEHAALLQDWDSLVA